MPAFICTACGCQYPNTATPPAACLICADARRSVDPAGQAWTALPEMRQTHFNAFRRLEPGLMGIGTFPAFAIGQRALLIRTPAGNILWDCIGFLDDATKTFVTALGGLAGIACSGPHLLGSVVEWSHAFDSVPVYLHAMDRKFVTRHDPVIAVWEGDILELTEGIGVIRCGGHFPGSSVLHWAQGAGGRGVLLTGDTMHVTPNKRLAFMQNYSNLIPLDPMTVQRIAGSLADWPFETIYGGWWDQAILSGAKQAVAESVERYLEAVTGSAETF